MFIEILFALATGIMVGLGVFQMLRRDLIKAAMGMGIIFTAINLFLLSVGAFEGEVSPYVEQAKHSGAQISDPVVQAVILTAVVVSFGSYALLLGMINIASRRYDTIDSDDLSNLKK